MVSRQGPHSFSVSVVRSPSLFTRLTLNTVADIFSTAGEQVFKVLSLKGVSLHRPDGWMVTVHATQPERPGFAFDPGTVVGCQSLWSLTHRHRHDGNLFSVITSYFKSNVGDLKPDPPDGLSHRTSRRSLGTVWNRAGTYYWIFVWTICQWNSGGKRKKYIFSIEKSLLWRLFLFFQSRNPFWYDSPNSCLSLTHLSPAPSCK